MKEFIEKLIARLEEKRYKAEMWSDSNDDYFSGKEYAYDDSMIIVNQLAEETIHESSSKSENVLESSSGWIPCSGCKDCKHKECEHYGKV